MLVPLAIAAYLLFRTPAPTLTNVAPATLIEGPGQRDDVNCSNLKPVMLGKSGDMVASAYFIDRKKIALVDVPP